MVKNKIAVLLLAISMIGTAFAEPIVTDSTTNSTSNTTANTTSKVISPPPTAVAPAITVINNDVCAIGFSGAAQTQILGISFGGATIDKNCERLKLSKTLFDQGMKVAAVALMCQDERVFSAMMNAGTPCPIDGKIGAEAKAVWEAFPDRKPQKVKSQE